MKVFALLAAIVAYQDMFRDAYDDGDIMHQMLDGWLDMAGDVNPVFYQLPTSGTNAQTWPLRYDGFTNSAFINTNADYILGQFYDVELLDNMLHDSRARNFYGFGHGSKDYFLGLDLAEATAFPSHRYRFVWMDGCQTATGNWDQFFHINGPGIFGLDYYTAHHRRPALFVGHTQEIPYARADKPFKNGIHYDGTIPSSIPYFRSNFVLDWEYEETTFTEAIDYAEENTPPIDPPMVFLSGPLMGSFYVLGEFMQTEGYDQMRWDEYNDYGDVP